MLAALALVLGACGTSQGDGSGSGAGGGMGQLTGGTWEYVDGRTAAGALHAPDDARITLLVDKDATVGGRAACNQYGGTVSVDGDRVSFGEISQTTMGCPPQLMDVEQQFLDGLPRVERAQRQDDRLVLSGPGVELRFVLQPPVEDEALEIDGPRLTLLADDGTGLGYRDG